MVYCLLSNRKLDLFFVFIFLFQELLAEGRLYDQLNQYFVNCRLTKEARVGPVIVTGKQKDEYKKKKYFHT